MAREIVFSKYLLDKYLEWVKNQQEPRTTAEFAAAVGISRQTINNLMKKGTDITPNPRTIRALAQVVGDDIYDYLGKDKPQVGLELVNQAWNSLPEEIKTKILTIVQPYVKQ
jgi:transcriptional regulator with XRE-family HTH domain